VITWSRKYSRIYTVFRYRRKNMQNTWKPVAGGIISIVAGSIHLLGWLAIIVALSVPAFIRMYADMPRIGPWIAVICTVPLIIVAIIAIIGGVFALKRRRWGLALAGAICAIFSPISWYLGVIATIFIALSRKEFGGKTLNKPPAEPSGMS
jgi:hypothetical protein